MLRPSLPKGELPLWTPYVRGTLFPLNPLANETARFLWMLPSEKNCYEPQDAHNSFPIS